jgi:NTE family protein
VKGDRIIATLKQLVGEQNIEELAIPFTAVAANVSTEKEVWIAKGCLFNAIRASISMPLFFTPFEFNGQSLIDGGVLNPVPIAPTFGDHNDLTIAVNLGAPPEALQPWEPVPEPVEGGPEEPFYRDMVKRFVDKFGDAGSTMLGKNFSAYDIASQSIDAMQGAIARQKLAAYPPDKVIDIPRNACGVLEFDKAAQMIDLGYSRAAAALPPVKA